MTDDLPQVMRDEIVNIVRGILVDVKFETPLMQHDEGGSSSLSQASPKKWLEYKLHLLLPKDQRESVIGDLEEEYSTIVFPKFGKRAADIWYAKQVMSSILPIVQARLLKLIGWATGGLGLGSAVEWFRKWSGGD